MVSLTGIRKTEEPFACCSTCEQEIYKCPVSFALYLCHNALMWFLLSSQMSKAKDEIPVVLSITSGSRYNGIQDMCKSYLL